MSEIKQISLQLTGGNNSGNRRDLDYYPTPENVTVSLMEYLNLPRSRTVWEPACGEGHMSNVIKKYVNTVYESDIIYGKDYLLEPNRNADVIITNPPFSLSEKFILKSLSESRIVCMLLKSQYWHAAKRISLFRQNPPAAILPLTWRPDFLEHTRSEGDKKGAPTMECIWTVWNKSYSGQTVYNPLHKPNLSL